MTNVRAKFKCQSETKNSPGPDGSAGSKSYQFYAVQGKDNAKWAKWTPGGNLQITIDNPEAQQFEAGKFYYLDFTDAPEKDE